MSTTTCPAGHASSATDYCDVCGLPIGAPAPDTAAPPAVGAATAAPPQATPAAQVSCPSCGEQNVADALFCESCGYDFTTGTMPRATPPTPDAAASVPPTPPAPQQGSADWVVERWVDPEWYAVQDSDDPCPSPGPPVVVPLTESSVLIGRPSRSRSITPQVDCGDDSGVSRRHAQLSTDGQRWWVEDLQSSNGTFVGPASGPVPQDPVPPGQRRELDDDRLYVGTWTRLVIRRATPEERG
ncbi:FHA domain-containing protein [Luteipulveratus sp. YIM 133132]|uniref:FHA domain-containing protein n=1 Tax=Luteipulveratus flavus TaxID=3031728 RepID=UPI0023AECAE2|nr:FHA domain-containing protein [Luteipulveratus sp. YIM 133132]MDE9365185.1 FHA domain-containing protein [Luteipulveratus sp. YIM 133132]